MNFEKVVFGFFITLAATLNFGFFIGEMDRPDLHSVWGLAAALAVSVIATILKFGDRTQLGAVHLATSLVADLQLLVAALIWTWAVYIGPGMGGQAMSQVVSFSGGALLANLISVVLLLGEIFTMRR
ncbi:DUF6394 family protein [Propioniciclava soli]|uniref:DUF6394 family protein n=1 Tax=Propioniciclava soli TaxID=2775081 RepID=A0ABZ3C824_9ACTN|nr:DUF6394 family protein [Propioniciclava soli]